MKQKKLIIGFVILLVGLGKIHAQEASTSAGGEAMGADGTVSYSVGQVMHSTHTGENGSVSQGVQQVYEISTTVGVDDTTINLELSVYPNPTADYLTLKVEKTEKLSYQLYDLQGRMLESKTINNNTTGINLGEHPMATYFLVVLKEKQIVKTFKIIKT